MSEVQSNTRRAAAELAGWRRAVLPFMQIMLVAMALFFFSASLWQLRSVEEQIRHQVFELSDALTELEVEAADLSAETRARLLLEADLVARRYHQANAIILARLWTRYLGFVTGMVLALVGAVFILGRLDAPTTKLTGDGQGFKGALETSSPGIVLAVLGTVLMGISLSVSFEVETRDASVYLSGVGAAPMPAARPLAEGQDPNVRSTSPACDPGSPFPEDQLGC